MPKGTVKLTFNNKKRYKYPIEVSNPTEPEIAVAVSKQILDSQVKKGMKRQSGGLPCYNLVTDLLRKQNIRYNLPEPVASNKEQAFLKAKLANESSPFVETECGFCMGLGNYWKHEYGKKSKETCPKCNGHGVVYLRTIYRVGKNTDRQLIVESDSTSPDNAKLIHEHLTKLFGYNFHVVKTTHGYHFVGTHINKPGTWINGCVDDWTYANCLVLKQDLQITYAKDYVSQLLKFDEDSRELSDGQVDKDVFETNFKHSGLYNGVGDFDILYTVLSIKYKKSTLRISKKHKDDKYEEVV